MIETIYKQSSKHSKQQFPHKQTKQTNKQTISSAANHTSAMINKPINCMEIVGFI